MLKLSSYFDGDRSFGELVDATSDLLVGLNTDLVRARLNYVHSVKFEHNGLGRIATVRWLP